jgi:hypothetical protein
MVKHARGNAGEDGLVACPQNPDLDLHGRLRQIQRRTRAVSARYGSPNFAVR